MNLYQTLFEIFPGLGIAEENKVETAAMYLGDKV